MNCNDCSSCNTKGNTKLPEITGGFLNLTQRCNLKCKYCFVHQNPYDMSFEVARDSADFYVRNALGSSDRPYINFFGGEPLLRWDDIIVPLTNYIRQKYGDKFDLSMTSNGVLLDKEKLDFMKENKIGLLFSIDGDKKTQDLNRPFHNGKGSFDLLKEKIPMILEYYPNMTFRATVDHDNVYDMVDNYKFAIDQGYTNVFMIPNVFTKWNEEEKEELETQCSLIADIYMEQLRNGKHIRFNQFDDARNRIEKINEVKDDKNHYRSANINSPGFGRCGIGASKFASIGPTGNIFSCQEMVENESDGKEFCIGNIYTGVDEKARWKILDKFDLRNIIRDDGQTCSDCVMNKICDGGCSINNYFANGNLEIMPSILCLFYQLMIKEYLRIMKTMSEENNEFFLQIYNNGKFNKQPSK